MFIDKDYKKTLNEFCNHCGRNVKFKSGLFINRVPDLNDIETRKNNGLKFPLGDFVCFECDDKTSEVYFELYF
jgi:hypothetical protein